MPRRMKTAPLKLDATDLPDLTAQQQEFVRLILAGKTGADAYRGAYDTRNMLERTIWAEASRTRHNRSVATWLSAARQANLGTAVLTKDSHMAELERIREIALATGNVGAAAKCEELRGKVAGHHIERVEVTRFNDPLPVLKKLAELNPERARELANKYKVDLDQGQQDTVH